ncbi:MlaD family protein [Nocardia sp. BMG111209]|uniref:MlaD family protein n=1 Tax=Nocardia sp. BMG111209 TaxID=1160137 RepID=UPI00039B779B|nr:MlaD family protein [Nocardia sp. BMG111209]
MTARGTSSLVAIAVILILGIGYMCVGVLHLDPRRSFISAQLDLPDSGGLGPNAPVLLDGIQVGRAEEVRKQASGVQVRLRIDDRYRIPLAGAVRIEQLSALGEPYIEFAPDSAAGPYIRDGQAIPTQRVQEPLTITALSTRMVELLNQVHPEVVAHLVGTFEAALSGTGPAVQTLQRPTTLLAATLLSRTDAVRRLLADIQSLGGDIDWLGPSLATAGPQFGNFGEALSNIVNVTAPAVEARPAAAYFTGDGTVPFLVRLTALLAEIGPGIAPLAPALAPVVADAANQAPRLDIGALIDQALHGVDPDGTVHIRIATK